MLIFNDAVQVDSSILCLLSLLVAWIFILNIFVRDVINTFF